MKKTLVVIPALNPPENLIKYVQNLKEKKLNNILIVNDGSNKKYDYIFNELEKKHNIIIYKHAKNLGKGRALKNAFNYFLNLPNINEFNGVITADSDGQHSIEDVLKLSIKLDNYPNSLLIGCRNFNGKSVPSKSKFGNKITRNILGFLYGNKLTDTQTGLRAFPTNIISEMIDIYGEKFEYETKMLIHCFEKNIEIKEFEIQTIYFDNNTETHFNPILDSVKIYCVILSSFIRYFISSFSSFIVDISLFNIFLFLLSKNSIDEYNLIIISTIFARIISSAYNYYMNKTFVFKKKSNIKKSIFKYYSLAIVQMLTSAIAVAIIWELTKFKEIHIKILVDLTLFIISYKIQRMWVFNRGKNE